MSASITGRSTPKRRWPDYAAVWRWHFYAGLFCIPFILWLATTGSIYLFRPDIEALLDRPYESLTFDGPRAAPAAEARAALTAMPGSVLNHYELPATPTGAAQVVVERSGHLWRVYVHPRTLAPMSIGRDDHRLMEVISNLHGNLLLGDTGSVIVELAASWAIVMVLTGLFLWWPRGRSGLGGLLYPRLRLRGRPLWRDLHAVAGVWVSLTTVFLLLSGLPWAKSWGEYMNWARNLSVVTAGQPTWPIGADPQVPLARAERHPAVGVHAHMAGMAMPTPTDASSVGRTGIDLRPLDRLVKLARSLAPPRPVWIVVPAAGTTAWTIESQAQDRPRQVSYAVTPDGRVIGSTAFADRNIVDKVVAVTTATHEGQLFGRLNQAVLLATAIGLVVTAVSGAVMWWRRRPTASLGAPSAGRRPGAAPLLALGILALAVLLPLFGLSLLFVLLVDVAVLPFSSATRQRLGRRKISDLSA